jgi:kynureninase
MVSFYRPAGDRTRIVIEDHAFPSDSYAVRSQARWHGLDPDRTVVRLAPRPGERTLRTEDVLGYLEREGAAVALVLIGAVNYLTGEVPDLPAITAAGRAAGAMVGWDLAHAAGNIPLRMHDWGADFAAWCSYKYLNGGPGAAAGLFVHERHLADRSLPRFEGWWSTDAATRFELAPVARPPATAEAWQISNPPIFSMAPVRTSLELFDKVGLPALRERSLRLTGYLERLLDTLLPDLPIITPREPGRRGCQLSLRAPEPGRLAAGLRDDYGVIADAREPDILRLAPAPLYTSYHDCWRAATALRDLR